MTDQPPQTELPRYYAKGAVFIAPNLIEAGSIFSSNCGPNEDLEPLNDAARAAFEDWYSEEFEYRVEDPNKPGQYVVVKHRPRENLRPVEGKVAGANPTVEVHRGPPRAGLQELSLANVNLRANTDQRPGPQRHVDIPEEYRTSAPSAQPPALGSDGAPIEPEVEVERMAGPPKVGSKAPSTITTNRG